MEGLGASLPAHKRVLGYDVWFEPLPRTTTGKLRRFEIQRRLKAQTAAKQAEASAPIERRRPGVARRRARRLRRWRWSRAGHRPAPRCGPTPTSSSTSGSTAWSASSCSPNSSSGSRVKVPEATAHEILTVRQLVDAVRPERSPRSRDRRRRSVEHDPVATCRRPTDPVLGRCWHRSGCRAAVVAVRAGVPAAGHARARSQGLGAPAGERARTCCARTTRASSTRSCWAACCRIAPSRQLFAVGAAEYFETPLMALGGAADQRRAGRSRRDRWCRR